MTKARQVQGEYHWFQKNKGNLFVVPYKRADSLAVALSSDVRIRKNEIYKHKQTYLNGCIYPKTCSRVVSKIPESIPLDTDFGFFIGAYLAEGLATNTYVCISNNDVDYRNRIYAFCDKYKITYHTVEQNNKIQEGWTSTDVRIHSVILARLMKIMCDTGSDKKFIPGWCYEANDTFVKALLDGYFSGDGCVHPTRKEEKLKICCTSVSENLVDGIMTLLTRFDIVCVKRKPKRIESNNRGSKNIKQHWEISIRNENVCKFANNITLTIKEKQEKLAKANDTPYTVEYFNYGNKFNNVYCDPIASISDAQTEHTHVYDFTVADTRNFCLFNGLNVRDTFHAAGSAEKSNVVRGVPRMIEILSLFDTKKPSLTVYLETSYRENKSGADLIRTSLEITTLSDVVRTSEIYFDPPAGNYTCVEQDTNIVRDAAKVANYIYRPDAPAENKRSPWVIRFTFDRMAMLTKGIVLDDIVEAISGVNQYVLIPGANTPFVVARSSDNAEELVIHVSIIPKVASTSNPDNDDMYKMRETEKFLLDNIVLKGVSGIERASLREIKGEFEYNEEEGKYKEITQWVIDTDGTNLPDVLNHAGVNFKKIISNDIWEVYNTLGVEAARDTIIDEIQDIMRVQSIGVNNRHVAILADRMTYNGYILSIDRNGINKDDIGPLARASFEKMANEFYKAAVFGELDTMRGVSANVYFGQNGYFGTSAFDVILDEDIYLETVAKHAGEMAKEEGLGEDVFQGLVEV